MLSSLLGGRKASNIPRHERSPFSSPFTERTGLLGARGNAVAERRRVAPDYDNSDGDDEDADVDEEAADDVEDDEDVEDEADEGDEGEDEQQEDDHDEDHDNGHGHSPLLPLFEASRLGKRACLSPCQAMLTGQMPFRCTTSPTPSACWSLRAARPP